MKNIFNKIKYFLEKRKLFNKVTLEQSNFVVLDTETTGLYSNKGDKIVSIAALKINNFEVDKQNYLNRLINPGIEIPLSSTQIHGINNEDIKQEPRLVDINKEILLFLKKSILVGHNIDFDIGFIKNDAKGTDLARRMSVIQPIDTIFLTAGLFPDLKNYQLLNLCQCTKWVKSFEPTWHLQSHAKIPPQGIKVTNVTLVTKPFFKSQH